MRPPLFSALAVAALAAGELAAQPLTCSTADPSSWMRRYSAPAFAEIWRVTIDVPDLKKAVARAVSRMAKRGAAPTVPLENMAASKIQGIQQLSYRVPAAKAAKAAIDIQKLGAVLDLQKRPGLDEGAISQARERLAALRAEEAANRQDLERMPATRAAIAEIIAHLDEFDRASREAAGRILFNIEVRARARASSSADAAAAQQAAASPVHAR